VFTQLAAIRTEWVTNVSVSFEFYDAMGDPRSALGHSNLSMRRAKGKTTTRTSSNSSSSSKSRSSSSSHKSMKRSLLVAAASCLLLPQRTTGQNPEVNTRTVDCPDSDPPLMGYDRLQDVTNDQFEEYQRIENGDEPRPPYVFRLCPNTEFMTDFDPFPVLLSGSMFTCGPNVASSDNCVFKGGFEVIKFEDSTIDGYTLEMASFVGITFDGFNGVGVVGYASAPTIGSFVDCVWQDFGANNVVKLGVENGVPTGDIMRVEISGGSVIRNGTGVTHFVNDAGTLVLDDVLIENITAAVSSLFYFLVEYFALE